VQRVAGEIRGIEQAVKDVQTVDPEGHEVGLGIEGVDVRPAVTHADELGTVCEIWDERWNFAPGPVPFVYTITIRPGRAKGWIVHEHQDDRLFFVSGSARVALYDARAESSTHGLVNVHHLGVNRRAIIRIPAGVFHALRNIGTDDVVFVNLPTRSYEHANPDKHRLPLDTDQIPYRA
jgi:dTDP-4-dehydrorhamnose 3,5-epimerase